MQLVHTFHARKSMYVNNIIVTVTLQAAVSYRGSGIWHYEQCRNVQNAEKTQHSSVGTSLLLSDITTCLQTLYRKQESPAIVTVSEKD